MYPILQGTYPGQAECTHQPSGRSAERGGTLQSEPAEPSGTV